MTFNNRRFWSNDEPTTGGLGGVCAIPLLVTLWEVDVESSFEDGILGVVVAAVGAVTFAFNTLGRLVGAEVLLVKELPSADLLEATSNEGLRWPDT